MWPSWRKASAPRPPPVIRVNHCFDDVTRRVGRCTRSTGRISPILDIALCRAAMHVLTMTAETSGVLEALALMCEQNLDRRGKDRSHLPPGGENAVKQRIEYGLLEPCPVGGRRPRPGGRCWANNAFHHLFAVPATIHRVPRPNPSAVERNAGRQNRMVPAIAFSKRTGP